METIEICVAFIGGILGIGYPILLEVVSRLDEKYGSLVILDLFNKEREKKYLSVLLVSSLVLVLLWILKLPPLFNFGKLEFLIEDSAIHLLLIATVSLITCFFQFISKIIIYYTPMRFVPYLIQKHNENSDVKNDEYFRAISDMLYYAIRKQNPAIAKTISDFMYDAFKKVRDQHPGKEIEYPTAYYEVVYKSIEELASQSNKKLTFIEYRTASGIWLLGEMSNAKISGLTYSWLWRNMRLALTYEQDNYPVYHWEQAHQRFQFDMKPVQFEHNDAWEIVNQAEVDARKAERDRFLEFHYALGGLLLYNKRYKVLGRFFQYTTSYPPRYELLPESMNEIFYPYFEIRDNFSDRHEWMSHRYPFPQVEGITADDVVKHWIARYFALLFIRQYSIVPYLVTMRPLDLPQLPDTQSGKRRWMENIDFFRQLVKETLENNELLRDVELSQVTDEWCEKNKHPKPLEFLDTLKARLADAYEGTKRSQSIAPSKLEQFNQSTLSILQPLFKEYRPVNNAEPLTGDIKKWFFTGRTAVFEKSAFAEDTDVHHLNFDTFLAESFSSLFRQRIARLFLTNRSKGYLLSPDDMIPAIKKLNLASGEYTLVCFDMDLIKASEKDKGAKSVLENLDVVNLTSLDYSLLGESIFVIRSRDLPRFNYLMGEEAMVKKYALERINDEYNLFTSVVDLNQSEELRKEEADPGNDLSKSVMACIFINLEVHWKKDVDCIHLQAYSPYRERGITGKLSDVKPLSAKTQE